MIRIAKIKNSKAQYIVHETSHHFSIYNGLKTSIFLEDTETGETKVCDFLDVKFLRPSRYNKHTDKKIKELKEHNA